jgi:hypothetical protein
VTYYYGLENGDTQGHFVLEQDICVYLISFKWKMIYVECWEGKSNSKVKELSSLILFVKTLIHIPASNFYVL